MLYKKVYFRLDRNGYESYTGWKDELSAQRFQDEIVGLFQKDGWIRDQGRMISGAAPTVKKGLQELYLHPMSASGVIIADEIPRVEAMLAGAVTFRHYHTDIYEDYVLMPDDEYLRLLEGKHDEIVGDILERFTTKRRNLYFCIDALDKIYTKHRVKRVGTQHLYRDLEASFISELFKELLDRGLIRTGKTKYGDGYRTAKDDELKSAGKSV